MIGSPGPRQGLPSPVRSLSHGKFAVGSPRAAQKINPGGSGRHALPRNYSFEIPRRSFQSCKAEAMPAVDNVAMAGRLRRELSVFWHATRRSIGRLSALASVAFLMLFPYTAPSYSTIANEGIAENQLRDAETQLAVALSGPDTDLLSRLWADDFVSTMADGHVVSRETRLDSLRAKAPNGNNKATSTNDRIEIRAHGDRAIVLVRSSWHVDGRRVGGRSLSGYPRMGQTEAPMASRRGPYH
jgi:hypothetical protein